jgi:hypothetical protein
LGSENVPVELLVVVRVIPLVGSVAVILALGTTAPVGSCTAPKIDPDVTWAHEDGRLNKAIVPSNHIASLMRL